MKRIVLALFMALSATVATAQEYVRIDSVIRPYIHFDYQSWMDSGKPVHPSYSLLFYYAWSNYADDTHSWSQDTCTKGCVLGDMLQYNYIEGGADIYGISVMLDVFEGGAHGHHPMPYGLYPSDFLYLYEATPDTFEQKGMLMIDLFCDTVYPTIYTGQGNNEHDCNLPFGHMYSCRNATPDNDYWFFFDKPIHVEDSFYVGASSNWFLWEDMHLDYILGYTGEDVPPTADVYYGLWDPLATSGAGQYDFCYDEECLTPYMKKKVRWRADSTTYRVSRPNGFRLNEWVPTETREFWMIFPLIKTYDTIWTVDTPDCLPVRDFGIMSRFGDTVILRSSPLEGRSEYQVSYGPEGTDPDSGTFVNVNNNRWRFIDTLHSGEVMVAYVRTVCRELDTLRYSEWSESVEWQTRVGIVQPDEDVRLSSRIHLQPNPAKDRVAVVTPCGVKGIEVYGSYGIRWREFPAGSTSFDVSDWAKGTYIVVVRTLAGSVTKKLVVE